MSDVAAESVMWLAHRLGPVLTSPCLLCVSVSAQVIWRRVSGV